MIMRILPRILSAITLILLSYNRAFAKVEKILGTPIELNKNIAFNLPLTNQSEIILSRDQYIISYNKLKRSPNYVAWKLESGQIGSSGRSNNFIIDNQLEEYLQESSTTHAVNADEYRGSCFDRGHQIPSADRTDTLANNEMTYLMSNMIPQTAFLNRVIWEHLERYSRELVQKQGLKLFIITGPIYDKAIGFIGPNNDIEIPSKNFKLIYTIKKGQDSSEINVRTPEIAVIMPNILQDGSTDLSNKRELCKPISTTGTDKSDWVKYKTSIDEIEKLTGLQFVADKN